MMTEADSPTPKCKAQKPGFSAGLRTTPGQSGTPTKRGFAFPLRSSNVQVGKAPRLAGYDAAQTVAVINQPNNAHGRRTVVSSLPASNRRIKSVHVRCSKNLRRN